MRRIGRNIGKLSNARLVLFNIPEDITLDNVELAITRQNPEKDIRVGDIKAKFCYVTKWETRNLVIEVDPSTRGKFLTTRIKLGWTICRVEEYIVAKSCYRCSRLNRTFPECKGEETCPHCAANIKRMNVQLRKVNRNASTVLPIIGTTSKIR